MRDEENGRPGERSGGGKAGARGEREEDGERRPRETGAQPRGEEEAAGEHPHAPLDAVAPTDAPHGSLAARRPPPTTTPDARARRDAPPHTTRHKNALRSPRAPRTTLRERRGTYLPGPTGETEGGPEPLPLPRPAGGQARTPAPPRGRRVASPDGQTRRADRPTNVNDPSAGSPTETLLRLLLPLDSQVRPSSQRSARAVGRPRRGRSEGLTKPSNR